MYYLNEIAQLEESINKVRSERFELMKSNDSKVQTVLEGYFNFNKELDIKVSRESACFRIKDEEGVLKELFNLYFYERYRGEDVKLEISYYTTNTHSEFELNRIILLGKVAEIVKVDCKFILQDIAEVKKQDIERDSELYKLLDSYEKEKSSYQKANDERRKTEIELSLRGQGVTFNKDVYFKLKRDYTIRPNSIKIAEVSKSGKTCTVEYVTREGYKNTEENCNVENIISQVTSYSNNIV